MSPARLSAPTMARPEGQEQMRHGTDHKRVEIRHGRGRPGAGRKLQQRMRTLKSIETLLVSMPKISGHGGAAAIPTCP